MRITKSCINLEHGIDPEVTNMSFNEYLASRFSKSVFIYEET